MITQNSFNRETLNHLNRKRVNPYKLPALRYIVLVYTKKSLMWRSLLLLPFGFFRIVSRTYRKFQSRRLELEEVSPSRIWRKPVQVVFEFLGKTKCTLQEAQLLRAGDGMSKGAIEYRRNRIEVELRTSLLLVSSRSVVQRRSSV